MTPVGLTRAGTIFPIVAQLKRIGLSVDRLLSQAELPGWIMSDAETLIPATSTVRLLGPAFRSTGIPNLGLTAGERSTVESLGTFGRLFRSAPTLGAALQLAARYSRTITSNRPLWLRPRGDRVEICIAVEDRFDPQDAAWQHDDHFCLGLIISAVRLAAGPHWRPTEVHLQTGEAAGLRDAETRADARIAFRQPVTMVVVPRAFMTTPLPPAAAPALAADVIDDWQSSAPVQDLAGSIRQAVETLSAGDDYPTVEHTAAFVGLSVRTLQRRLAAVGVSHDELVGQTRFAMAAAVLAQTDAKILDLALDLGYSDHANFTRAFRRWAGCSPRDYRRKNGGRRHSAKSPGRTFPQSSFSQRSQCSKPLRP